MIRNILFDMGGVIILLDPERALARFQEYGIDSRYLDPYCQKGYFLDLENGAIDKEEFCRKMAETSGRAAVTPEEAMHCWMGIVREVPVDRLHNLLKLKEKYNLGLLSNTNPFVMEYADSPALSSDGRPLSDYFHKMYLSYELKVCKPSPEIFQKVLTIGNMVPSETIFIDDSLPNIQAAESLGIHGLYVETNQDWSQPLAEMLKELDR